MRDRNATRRQRRVAVPGAGRCSGPTRGAALVEFALVLPLLLLLFLGILEFGVVALQELTLVQVAREGSRHASLGKPVAQIEQPVGRHPLVGLGEFADTVRPE